MTYLFLFARILFGGFFLISGVNHFTKTAMYTQSVASKKVPAPAAAVLGSGALIVLGGMSILLGLFPVIGFWLIVAFLVGVTPMMHAFWKLDDPLQRTMQRIQFLKNVALLGATLMMIVFTTYMGPWPFRMVR
ncbi:MAG TPA: DoxX family membrane protein [Patescibacteria group bacterium]|nr:DoxX family membrane protein [Patescibacteria group bacterium]